MTLKNYLFLIALSSFIASSFADDRSVTSLPASSLQDSKNDHTTIEYLQKRSDTTTPAYQDSEGIFEFHGPNGVNVLKDCTWFQSNTKWRCNNFDTAKEVCIKTCNIPDSPSNVPTAQPSSLTPQIVSAPTDPLFIPWCSDSVAKFDVYSIDRFAGKKGCKWVARKDKWWRCSMPEVKSNCPSTCRYCKCFNNPSRFETPIANGKRTCNWAKRKHTEKRCSDSHVAANCPLACGECETDGLIVTANSTVSIPLQGSFPTEDDDELTLFKNALIEAFQSLFLSSAGTILDTIDVQILSIGECAVCNFIVVIRAKFSIACNPDCQTALTRLEKRVKTVATNVDGDNGILVLATNIASYDTSEVATCPGEKSTTETIQIQINETTAVPTAAPTIIPSQIASTTETIQIQINNATTFPTTAPTVIPSQIASTNQSVQPSKKTSKEPTLPPTKTPTRHPTRSPTTKPSQVPSLIPSSVPSLVPSANPSLTQSIMPSL